MGARFRNCAFVGADLKDIAFQAGSFLDCRFEGELENVSFDAGAALNGAEKATMSGVDFSGCEVAEAVFTGLELSGILLPARSTAKDSLRRSPGDAAADVLLRLVEDAMDRP